MNRTRLLQSQRGFTLPELIIAVAVFAVIGSVSLWLLRPTPMDVEKRNAQRQTGTAYIVQAVTNYYQKYGKLPEAITTSDLPVSAGEDSADICRDLVPAFANDLPYDPLHGGFTVEGACSEPDQDYITGYTIRRNSAGTEITVSNKNAEGGKIISITKQLK